MTVRLECDFCGAVHEVAEEHLATADLPWYVVKVETVTDEHVTEWVVCPTCMEVKQREYKHEPPSLWDLLKAAKVEQLTGQAAWKPWATPMPGLVPNPDGLLGQELAAAKTILEDLCVCGHPRSMHEYEGTGALSGLGPCTSANPEDTCIKYKKATVQLVPVDEVLHDYDLF